MSPCDHQRAPRVLAAGWWGRGGWKGVRERGRERSSCVSDRCDLSLHSSGTNCTHQMIILHIGVGPSNGMKIKFSSPKRRAEPQQQRRLPSPCNQVAAANQQSVPLPGHVGLQVIIPAHAINIHHEPVGRSGRNPGMRTLEDGVTRRLGSHQGTSG